MIPVTFNKDSDVDSNSANVKKAKTVSENIYKPLILG